MNDLKVLRKKVADIIIESENMPIMAEFIMEIGSPKEIIEEEIDACDCYLGIFDKKWGYIPPNNNPDNLSVSAIEYERAKKKRIPRLILVSKKEKEKELEKFINKISNYEGGEWCNDYQDEAELLRLVTRGIPKLVAEIKAGYGSAKCDKDEHLFLLPPLVSPSIVTYSDKIEDISPEKLDFIIEKILGSANSDVLLSAWSDLEIYTRNKRTWKQRNVCTV